MCSGITLQVAHTLLALVKTARSNRLEFVFHYWQAYQVIVILPFSGVGVSPSHERGLVYGR
jgi:hypothetical protein